MSNGCVLFSQKIRAYNKAEHSWLCKVADRLWGKRAQEEGWPEKAESYCDVDVDELVFPDWVELKNGGILVYTKDGAMPASVTPLVRLFIRKFHQASRRLLWGWSCIRHSRQGVLVHDVELATQQGRELGEAESEWRVDMQSDQTVPQPASDEQLVRLGSWAVRTVRRFFRRPGRYQFRVITKDGQWHDESVNGYDREQAKESLYDRYDDVDEILDR